MFLALYHFRGAVSLLVPLRAGVFLYELREVDVLSESEHDRRDVGAVAIGRQLNTPCDAVSQIAHEPLGLDQTGIAAHSGSACSSESLDPSPVLEAMGVEAERSLRVSVGWSTIDADVDAFVGALPQVVEKLRALRS